MTPGEGGRFFLCSCLAGAGLGLFYGFLRPLGARHRHWADGLFCLGAGAVWLVLGFGVFRGDLRPGLFLGLPLGVLLWEWGPGALLRPVWRGFWGCVWKILGAFSRVRKKVWNFFKFPLSIRGKIGYNRRQIPIPPSTLSGGIHMERTAKRKFIFRPGTRGMKILCTLAVVLALVALAAGQLVCHEIAAMTEEKRQQAAGLEQENKDLQEKKDALGSVDSVKDIAESELGYVNPDAVVIGEK